MLRLASWTSFFASKPPSSFLLLERIQAPRDLEHKFSLIHMNSALLVELSKLFRTKTCVFLLNRWISPINACICLKKNNHFFTHVIIEEKIIKKTFWRMHKKTLFEIIFEYSSEIRSYCPLQKASFSFCVTTLFILSL